MPPIIRSGAWKCVEDFQIFLSCVKSACNKQRLFNFPNLWLFPSGDIFLLVSKLLDRNHKGVICHIHCPCRILPLLAIFCRVPHAWGFIVSTAIFWQVICLAFSIFWVIYTCRFSVFCWGEVWYRRFVFIIIFWQLIRRVCKRMMFLHTCIINKLW